MKKDFLQLPHTADIKIRVVGKNLKELFANALYGMFQVVEPIAPDCTIVDGRISCKALPKEHVIEVRAIDVSALLVDFLSEALYLSDVYNEAYLDVAFQELNETHLKATLYGVPITGFQVVELKAVTYHDLSVIQKDGQWQADIVFDI